MFLFLPMCPGRQWRRPSLPLNGQRGHFPQGLKRLACEADYSNPSSVEVRKKVELYLRAMVTVLNTNFMILSSKGKSVPLQASGAQRVPGS